MREHVLTADDLILILSSLSMAMAWHTLFLPALSVALTRQAQPVASDA